MKGVILHSGHGERLRLLTHNGPKQLIPAANKPISQYVLEDLKNSGISEIASYLERQTLKKYSARIMETNKDCSIKSFIVFAV